MSVEILSIATARPAGSLSQEQAFEVNVASSGADERQAGVLRRLYRRSGVEHRASVLIDPQRGVDGMRAYYPPATSDNGHGPSVAERMARYEQEVLPLARAAAIDVLENVALPREEITQLVTVSCTGFAAPGLEARLITSLGLCPTVGRTTVGFMGCHGAINGLRVASALASERPGATVMLCAVELCSLHFHYGWGEGRAVANTLFADGAAATLLRAGEPGGGGHWKLRACGSRLLDDSDGDMSWRIGDHGFEMTLSSRVPAAIRRQLPDWLDGWLAENGLRLEDVRSWAIHPGGPRVIDSVQAALGLDDEDTAASRRVLADHGNMSSPTVLFILERLARRRAPGPCVALAFGPGLVVEAALFD